MSKAKTRVVLVTETPFNTTNILPIRKFASGATRDTDSGKHDFEGYESIQVQLRFAEYMTKNRLQKDGSVRESSNWKRGIDKEAYVKSLTRHHKSLLLAYRGLPADDIEESLCAVLFNAQGLLFELLAAKSGRRERADG